LARFDVFGDSLIGMIDPNYPLNETDNSAWREITFAVQDPGVYYFGISTVLALDEDGSLVLTPREDPERPDEPYLSVEPFTSDQYTFRVTRTQLTPNYHDSGNDARLGSGSDVGSGKDVKALLRGMSPFL